ncbi:hypothetical protein [Campylobacter jejuni]|uniref:hypothetical protein n=1 Tax=Campylobacter jejuni TaxID=197 RepID=UPI00069C56FB|nr:hypothetical protein [Campylobacter jejuni]
MQPKSIILFFYGYILFFRRQNFKKEHPQDFNELFEILKDLIQEYEQNPNEIKQNLKEILK